MRVVIELKRDTNPQDVLQQLYHQTALSTNFGAILLALVDGQPRQLSLRQLLQEFLKSGTDLQPALHQRTRAGRESPPFG